MNQDINEELLGELRSIRRHTQYEACFMIIMALVLIAYMTWSRLERQRAWQGTPQPTTQRNDSASKEVWPSIDAALDQGENQKALTIAQEFVARQPQYYYAHATLGTVYLATGDYSNAEAAYVRAVDLYPDEHNEKALSAIRKRLGAQEAKSKRQD
jgi:cytochrome c-type biogenesis protein CcmH/NrfG